MKRFFSAAACVLLWSGVPGWSAPDGDGPIAIVAAENFYGDVARQIGGPEVRVTSIISTPGQDPHLFEASPAAARAISTAGIVVYNGAGYDPWIEKLLASSKSPQRKAIVAADLLRKQAGDNPHFWYDPATMPAVASAIARELTARDPIHQDLYAQRLKAFVDSLAPIEATIRAIKAKFEGTRVTATEPVFGYMAKALGFDMQNERFQLAVMNRTEPSASDVAAMQDDLKGRKVRILFYNSQVSDDMTERLRKIAQAAKVAVVGVTETEPADKTFQAWIAGELDAVGKALDGGAS